MSASRAPALIGSARRSPRRAKASSRLVMAAPRLAASGHHAGVAQHPLRIVGAPFDQRRAARDRLQHVVEVMRDAAGDLTQGVHPFRMRGALLGGLARRHLIAHTLFEARIDLLLDRQQPSFGIDVEDEDQRFQHLAVQAPQRLGADAQPGFAAVAQVGA